MTMHENDSLPLFTVTLDGEPVAIVKACDFGAAINAAEAFVLERLNASLSSLGARPRLSESERGRTRARRPTEMEKRHYAARAAQLPSGVAAVALP